MNHKPHSRRLVWWVLVMLSLIPFWMAYDVHGGYAYDDAYITLTYAKNVAAGRGFVYNGGDPYLGTTTPLLVLVLAAFHRLLPVLSIPTIAVWFGASMWTLSILMSYLIGRKVAGDSAGLLLAALSATNYVMIQVLSAEFPMLVALSLMAIYLAMCEREWLSGITLGLAFLARGDAVILAGIIGVALLWRDRRIPWRLMIGFFLPVLPWLLYASNTFGRFLPATLEMKRAHRAIGAWSSTTKGFMHWFRNHKGGVQIRYALSLLLSSAGLVYFLRTRNLWAIVIVAWGMLYAVAYAILDVPFYTWYVLVFFTSISLGAGFAVVYLARALSKIAIRKQNTAYRIIGFALGGGIVLMLLLSSVFASRARPYPGNVQPKTEAYIKVGEWLRENTPPDSTVGFIEVGWVGYFSERHILDLLGLVTPGAAPYLRAKAHGDLLEAWHPDYYIRNRNFDSWGMNKSVHDSYFFQAHYSPVVEIPQWESQSIVIYQRDSDVDSAGDLAVEEVLALVRAAPGQHLALGRQSIPDFENSAEAYQAISGEQDVWLYVPKPISDHIDPDLFTHLLGIEAIRLETDQATIFWTKKASAGRRLEILQHLGLLASVSRNQLVELWRKHGAQLRREQAYVEAVIAYQHVLEMLPEDSEATIGISAALLGLGQHAEALPYLQKSVQLQPNGFWPHRFLGNVYWRLGEYDLASSELAAAYAVDSSDAQLLLDIARTSMDAGLVEQAYAALQEAQQREDTVELQGEIQALMLALKGKSQ